MVLCRLSINREMRVTDILEVIFKIEYLSHWGTHQLVKLHRLPLIATLIIVRKWSTYSASLYAH